MCRRTIYLVPFVAVLVMVHNVSAGLVGHWTFDEGAGPAVADSSGRGNHGTFGGNAAWAQGNFGGAVLFDGSSWVQLPPQAWDPIERQVSVAFWAFGGDAMPVNHFVFAAYSADDNPARQASAHIPWSNGNVYWDTGYDGANYDRLFTALPAQYHKGSWVHWAFTKSADTGEMKIYINGVLFHSGTGMTRPMRGVNAFTIGVRATSDHAQGYVGRIDDFRLYDREMTADQVLSLSNGVPPTWLKAYAPDPADGALHPNTWVQLSWTPGDRAVSHDVYVGDNFDDVDAGTAETFRGNQTAAFVLVGFPGYAYPDGLVPGTTYYWRIDEVNDADPNSPWKGSVWSFSIPPRTAYDPNPADGAASVALNASLRWTAGFGAKLHTVYFGDDFDDVNNAATGTLTGTTTYNPGPLEAAKVYYWRVDESDPPNTYKGQVWSFTTLGAVGSPYPSNGESSAEMNAILTWMPSDSAASHQVYFGTDKEAVRRASATSPEYKGVRALGAESYDPGVLPPDGTYYWRIDEVNNANAASPWKGPLWSFTTGDFLLVDGFESYNDIDPPDPASQRIFDVWIDGFGTTTNGALVGNELPPYAERTVVHGGAQSMPYSYDNNLKFSEATRTLVSGRDWTAQGVTSLSLWFRGASANAPERMYVALNGTAAVYHEDPAAAQTSRWTEWVIPLQAFADQGVNLANVTSISIGFGTRGNTTAAGGAGQMYFDDIRLYR